MKLIITGIENKNDNVYVTGNTDIGNIRGKWCYKDAPVLEETYFFELDIEEVARDTILILRDEKFCPSVCVKNEQVEFKGICEQIDDIYVVRFATDWIEMISVKDDDFSIKKGDAIAFSVSCNEIGVYPYTI